MPNIFSRILTLLSVSFAWVFFRAAEFSHAKKIIESMLGFNGFYVIPKFSFLAEHFSFIKLVNFSHILLGKTQIFYIALALAILMLPNTQEIMEEGKISAWKPNIFKLVMFSFLLICSILNMNRVNSFIYFQF